MKSMSLKMVLLAAALAAGGCSSLGTREPEAGATGNVWSKSMEAKRVALESSTRDTGIAVLRTKDNQLQVNVPSDFSFDTDRADIKPNMRPVLDQFAEDLKSEALSHLLIHIIGYTDSKGSDAVNDALSLARAVSVRKHLESKGIASSRIEVEGRGEREPMAGNEQRYGRALNRRVEILLREPGKS